jgi:hypothetical protein
MEFGIGTFNNQLSYLYSRIVMKRSDWQKREILTDPAIYEKSRSLSRRDFSFF